MTSPESTDSEERTVAATRSRAGRSGGSGGTPAAPWPRRVLEPSIGGVIGFGFALWGFFLGIRQLSDNSFFTHLATGRLILDNHAIPASDPYSFTAHGEPWLVQSWLASLTYGVVERWFGAAGLRLLTGVLCAAIAWLTWRLARRCNLLLRVIIVTLAMVIGAIMWSPRPLLFGLLFLAITLLVAEGEIDPRWLVPVFWLWVNTHGSFPLGLVALAVLYAGRRLDKEDASAELRGLKWAAIGTLVAVINPLGPKILLFPIELLRRSESLQVIIEWKSPSFLGALGRVFLLQVVITILALVRRPSWRGAGVVVVFLAAALLGQRNITVASLLFVLVAAHGLAGLGTLTGKDRSPVFALVGAVATVAILAVSSASLAEPAYDLMAFPVDAVSWLDQHGAVAGASTRLATNDTTGNFLELLYGDRARAFMDDRVDMYPKPVIDDLLAVMNGTTGWQKALDDRQVDVVLWERGGAGAELLTNSPAWRVVYQDAKWMVACRRGTTTGTLTC